METGTKVFTNRALLVTMLTDKYTPCSSKQNGLINTVFELLGVAERIKKHKTEKNDYIKILMAADKLAQLVK